MRYTELFDKMLARPALYVGNCNIVRLGAFMNGYRYATLDSVERDEDDLYLGFTRWVARQFNITTMHDWVGMIDFMAGSEAAAYEMTVKMWNEYKAACAERGVQPPPKA